MFSLVVADGFVRTISGTVNINSATGVNDSNGIVTDSVNNPINLMNSTSIPINRMNTTNITINRSKSTNITINRINSTNSTTITISWATLKPPNCSALRQLKKNCNSEDRAILA